MGPSVHQVLGGILDRRDYIDSYRGGPRPLPPPPPAHPQAPNAPRTQITLRRLKTWLKQLLLGLDCLHSSGIAHGDLSNDDFWMSIRSFTDQDVQNFRRLGGVHGISDPVWRLDGKQDLSSPQHLYASWDIVDYVDMRNVMSAKISDLGTCKPSS